MCHQILIYTQNINPYEDLSAGSDGVPRKQTDRSTVGHMTVLQALCQNA
jgi:hypothetical protein